MNTNTEKIETATPSNRMTGDKRRMQILHIAIELFSKKGFSGTTTKEIAAAAGISEAMVFRHFATKEELYSAILDYKACEGEDLTPRLWVGNAIAEEDDFKVFYSLAINALERHEKDTKFMRLLMHSALEGHALSEMFIEQNIMPIYEFLGGYIRERQKQGVFRKIEARLIVRAFIGMLIHHSLNNTLWDRERKVLDVSNEEAARAFAEIALNGIKK